MTSACLVGSALLVSLLMLPISSEVKEREEAKHRHRDPINDGSQRFVYRQDGQMIAFDNTFIV